MFINFHLIERKKYYDVILKLSFHLLNMLTNVVGNNSSSQVDVKKTVASLFLQKPNSGTTYLESCIEEGIDMKNQDRIKDLKDTLSIRQTASKIYVDNLINDPSIIRKTAHVYFKDKSFDNVPFVKIYSMPAVGEHLTAE